MAITKEVSADRIEVVTGKDDDGNVVIYVQVRTTTRIIEDGVLLTESYHRHVIQSNDDYSSEAPNVQAICVAAFGS